MIKLFVAMFDFINMIKVSCKIYYFFPIEPSKQQDVMLIEAVSEHLLEALILEYIFI